MKNKMRVLFGVIAVCILCIGFSSLEAQAANENDPYLKYYKEFVNGKRSAFATKKDTPFPGKTKIKISDYTKDKTKESVAYYFIKAKGAKHPALVISYSDYSYHNDVYYYENGKIRYKCYFGRHATGGSDLINDTYIVLDSSWVCGCSFTDIDKFDKNYNLKKVRYLYDNDQNMMQYPHKHTAAQLKGYATYKKYGVSNGIEYIKKYCGVKTIKSDYAPRKGAKYLKKTYY